MLDKTDRYKKGDRWRVRYIDPSGQERNVSYPDGQKRAADAFLVQVENDKLRGDYLDPRKGLVQFQDYAETWIKDQTFDETTRDRVERFLRLHVYPVFGRSAFSAFRPSTVGPGIGACRTKALRPRRGA